MTSHYRRLHILVEGQTEEAVVQNVLGPYFAAQGWSATLSILTTKRVAGGPSHKGGLVSWNQLQREIRLLLRDPSLDVLTTMLDYYAFPADAPGMASRPIGTPRARVEHVEMSMAKHFDDDRLLPHLVLHETVAWVFTASAQLAYLHGQAVADQLERDVSAAGGPETVNDDPKNAPSKRLSRYCPGYVKTSDGPWRSQISAWARSGAGAHTCMPGCPGWKNAEGPRVAGPTMT